MVEPLSNGHFGNFGASLLLYKCCPLSEVKLCCDGPQNLSFIERSNLLCRSLSSSLLQPMQGYLVMLHIIKYVICGYRQWWW